MRVDVEQLRKHYGVDGISFSLDPGECLAVVGVNGAGKSTLLRCLAGWLVPERGRLRYDEQRFSRQRWIFVGGYFSYRTRHRSILSNS